MRNDAKTVPPDLPGGSCSPVADEPALPENARFAAARCLVASHGRASPAWLQRQLGSSYNEALQHVERMEREGWVTAPDHVGRRKVLAKP